MRDVVSSARLLVSQQLLSRNFTLSSMQKDAASPRSAPNNRCASVLRNSGMSCAFSGARRALDDERSKVKRCSGASASLLHTHSRALPVASLPEIRAALKRRPFACVCSLHSWVEGAESRGPQHHCGTAAPTRRLWGEAGNLLMLLFAQSRRGGWILSRCAVPRV